MDQFQKYRLLIVIMRCMKKVELFLFFFEICIFFRMPELKFKAGTDRRNCASVFTSLISMAAKQFTRTLECPFRPTNVNQTNLSFNHLRIKCVDLHWNYEISKVQNAGDYICSMLKKNDSIRWDLSNLKQRKKLVFLLKIQETSTQSLLN